MAVEIRNAAISAFSSLAQFEPGQIAPGIYLERRPVVNLKVEDVIGGGQRRVVQKVGEHIGVFAHGEVASQLTGETSVKSLELQQVSETRGQGKLTLRYDTEDPLTLPVRFGRRNLTEVETVLFNLQALTAEVSKRSALVKR